MSSYLLTVLAAAAFATQASPTPPASPKKEPAPPITLTGCVKNGPTPDSYTFSDAKTGVTYRLRWVQVPKDARSRGEVFVGTGSKRVSIRGGLVPSANVAAQAGDLDTGRAVVAAMPGGSGSGTGVGTALPEFRVMSFRTLKGTCP